MLSQIFRCLAPRAVCLILRAFRYHTQIHSWFLIERLALLLTASMEFLVLRMPVLLTQLPGCFLHLQDLKHWFLLPVTDTFPRLQLLPQRNSQTPTGQAVTIVRDITCNRPTIRSHILPLRATIHPYYLQRTAQMPRRHRRLHGQENNKDKPTTMRTACFSSSSSADGFSYGFTFSRSYFPNLAHGDGGSSWQQL